MSESLQPATSVAIARQLANAHPGSQLPCPLCGSTLKSANLDRHLGKAHTDHANASPEPSGPLRMRGIDRKMVLPGFIVVGLWVVGTVVGTEVIGDGGRLGPVGAVVLCVTGLLAFMPLFAAFAGKFPATLELDGDTLRLRWLLGLASKQVKLPAKLETGALNRRFSSQISADLPNPKSHTVKVGCYLRLIGDQTITIGAEKAAGLGKNWAQQGWSQGGKAESSEIEIDREALVALEYRLAARGQLTPKSS